MRLEEIEELLPSLRAQGWGRLGCIPEEGDQVEELIVGEVEQRVEGVAFKRHLLVELAQPTRKRGIDRLIVYLHPDAHPDY